MHFELLFFKLRNFYAILEQFGDQLGPKSFVLIDVNFLFDYLTFEQRLLTKS